jgi:hypothetical protein
LAAALDGATYRDGFHVPYGAWYPEVPEPVYLLLLWLAVPAAVMLTLGAWTRPAAAYCALFVGYNLFLTRTHYHHNRAFLLVLLVGVALLPVGAAVSVDAWRRRRAGKDGSGVAVRWPLMLLRFQVAAVYGASGFSKLIDGDWWSGVVTQLRVERYAELAVQRGVPEGLVDLAASSGFHAVFAKIAVLTELFIAVGLLTPRLRLAAVWVAIPFHLAIQLTASVEVFTYAALAALVIWVTPQTGDRTAIVSLPRHAAMIRALDWTGRFTVVRAASAAPELRVVDRDGSVTGGREAWLLLLARLPATFWLAAPLRLFSRARAG